MESYAAVVTTGIYCQPEYGRTRSVADLLVGWAAHVNKLHAIATCGPVKIATRGTPTTVWRH